MLWPTEDDYYYFGPDLSLQKHIFYVPMHVVIATWL